MLHVIESVPAGLLHTTQQAIGSVLAGPTLMHLEGRRPEHLFVAALQHGNEDVGLRAVQRLLNKFNGECLPRSLSVFFANVEAAGANARHLPHQPDYNRVWPGGAFDASPEAAMMREVVHRMAAKPLFGSVDLHNNMGLNPHYACVNRLDNRCLRLATLFSRTVVYFTRPRGVQSAAFASLCPSVTLECGQAGDERGIKHATDFLDACLHLSHLSEGPVHPHDIELFHTTAIVKVPPEASLGVGNEETDADIVLIEDLEFLNFRELLPGTVLASAKRGYSLQVTDERGRDVSSEYIASDGGRLRLKRHVMPSMLTVNTAAIRQDCLCYFMERFSDSDVPTSPR